MWIETYHRFADRQAFLNACDAAGWARGPDHEPGAGEGFSMDVIGPAHQPPVWVDGRATPGAVDARWHVNLSRRAGLDLPSAIGAAEVFPATPLRVFALPPPPPPMPPAVPATVASWKGKAALREAGLLAAVEAAVGPAASRLRDAWAGAPEWHRDSPFIRDLAAGLGLTAATLDQMFIAADKIRG